MTSIRRKLSLFTASYAECALWASTSEDGTPLDKHYGINDLASDAVDKMIDDCARFQEAGKRHITDDQQAGHDFWLTRNGHGAGFWDGDWPEPAATELTELSKTFGECWLYVGDDGKLYLA